MTYTIPGALDQSIAIKIHKIYAADDLTDLPAILRSTDPSIEEVAAAIANQCFAGQWRGRMRVQTADQIKCEVENWFRPPEPPPVDPLAEAGARNVGSFDPWARHADINEPAHVTTLSGAGRPTTIEYIEGDDAA